MIKALFQRQDITPATTGSYVDIDISYYVGSHDPEIAFIEFEKTSGTDYQSCAVRNNGSTDDIRARLYYNYGAGHYYANTVRIPVGVDADNIFECYIEDASIKVYLIGYVTSEDAVAFTNCVDKSTATTGSYIDVDISSDTGANTAIAAFCKMFVTLGFTDGTWLRCNGSTDDYSATQSPSLVNSPMVKVDANEIFEQYITNTRDDLYLVGYLLSVASGYTLSTNLTGYDTGATMAWTEFDTGDGSGKVSLFLLSRTISASARYGLRDVSGTRGYGYLSGQGSFTLVNTDIDGHIEGYQTSSGDFALKLGYYETPPEYADGLYIYKDGVRRLACLDANIQRAISDGIVPSADNTLLDDGTTPLTANWDAGSFQIRAETFQSDVAAGTAPLTIASTTLVSNLNADYVDSIHGTDLLKKDGSVALTADWDIGASRKISAEAIYARSSAGLKLYEDGGAGIFIQDGGNIGIGTTTPSDKLTLYSSTASVRGVFETTYASGNAGLIVKNPAGRNGEVQFWDADSRQWSFGAISDNFAIQKYSGSWSTKFYIDFTTEQTYALKGLYIGDGTAGTDFTLTFDGETNDGILTWMEDEDYFKFSDDILMNSTERVYFRDTGISIFSQADGYMNLVADGAVRIGDATPTNYVQIGATGNLSFVGSAGFYPRRISQSAEPANGTGDTQIDVGELIIWRDPDDNKTYLVYNDTNEGVRTVELT